MALRNPPSWLQQGSHPAENDRLSTQGTYRTSGILDTNDLLVSASSPAAMTVQVAAGWGVIVGDYQSNMGAYQFYNDAATTLTVTANTSGNPRIDRVVVTVSDAAYTGLLNQVAFQVIAGTPAGSPVAPATPTNSISLATIAVANGASSIVAGNITDTRTLATSNAAVISAAIPKTIIDAKGDLLVGTAADTVARLPIGTDGQALVADSTTATGMKWSVVGGSPAPQLTLTTSGTWASGGTYAAPRIVYALCMQGGGGGGGGGASTGSGNPVAQGGGGGGGAGAIAFGVTACIGNVNYTIGAGGAGNSAGGTTTFASVSATSSNNGGANGGGTNSINAGGGGTPSGGGGGGGGYTGGTGGTGGNGGSNGAAGSNGNSGSGYDSANGGGGGGGGVPSSYAIVTAGGGGGGGGSSHTATTPAGGSGGTGGPTGYTGTGGTGAAGRNCSGSSGNGSTGGNATGYGAGGGGGGGGGRSSGETNQLVATGAGGNGSAGLIVVYY